jgi:hypothetical protein
MSDKSNKAQRKDKSSKGGAAVAEPPAKKETVAKSVAPTGEPVNPPTAQTTTQPKKEPTLPKNHTNATIDPNDAESADRWLQEFFDQCEKQPPTKGYDQHWNALGFIHRGPATRLDDQGSARMIVFLIDALAQRAVNGEKAAGTMLDFVLKFGKTRRDALVEKQNKAAQDAAAAILKAAGVHSPKVQ